MSSFSNQRQAAAELIAAVVFQPQHYNSSVVCHCSEDEKNVALRLKAEKVHFKAICPSGR